MSPFEKKIEQIYRVDDKNIFGFFKEHRFLSNFQVHDIWYDGIHYTSTESAYQASKSLDLKTRLKFSIMPPSLARKEGQLISIREDWEDVKLKIMEEICSIKFSHWRLRELLKKTGDRYLEETNWWGDTFWGADVNHFGENNLGKILMKIREKKL